MKSIITNLDAYSSEVYFTVNSGNKRIKTVYGGVITIAASLSMIALFVIFLIQFFQGSSSSVLSKDKSTDDLNIDLNNYPFMLRLSTEKVQPYNDTKRLYSISLKLKIGGGVIHHNGLRILKWNNVILINILENLLFYLKILVI